MSSRRQLVGLGALALVASTVPLAPGAAEAPPPADGSLVVSGELQSVVVDDFTGGTSRTATTLLLRDGTRLDVVRTRGMPTTGQVTATVATETSDERLTTRSAAGLDVARDLVGQPVRLLRPTYVAAPAAAGATAHRAYVAVMTDDGGFDDVTDEELRATVAGATGYWTTEAGEQMPSFTVEDIERFDSDTSCGLTAQDFFPVTDRAARLYPEVDFGMRTANHLVVLVRADCPGSATGLGTIGAGLASGGSSVNVADTGGAVHTISHELGHNLSLRHANAEQCTPSSPTGCTSLEYGDLYDVMGLGTSSPAPALSSAHRHALGLLDPEEESEVLRLPDDESSVEQTVELAPRGGDSGVRTLQLVDPESGEEIFVDYRSGSGRDSGAYYTRGRLTSGLSFGAGVTITSLERNRATTLRTRYVGPTDFRGSWLPGQRFGEPGAAVSVSVDSIAGGVATVTATLESESDSFPRTVRPLIRGVPRVGGTLTYDGSGWPDGTELEQVWLVDGEPAPYDDAFGSRLTLLGAYRGATVQLEVTARLAGYRAVTVRSAAVGPVTSGPALITTSRPTISGRPVVGGRLRARPGRWTPGTEFSYQWRAGRRVVRGATGARLRLVRAHRGQRITVRVTGSKRGYRTERRTSAPTRPVRR